MTDGWTPERRARQVVLIGTWRPWECSTGPRSAAGKAKSALNARKHGLRSQGVLYTAEMAREILRISRATLQ